MKTVGSILQEARKNKKVTLDQAEVSTKIRKKFLIALESDDFTGMPSISYAKGFVKNYSTYLGLDHEKVLAFFRRQNVDIPKSSLLPHGVSKPLNESFFQLTPTKFIGIIIGLLAVVFLSYFGIQFRKIQTPPRLTIETPAERETVKEKRIDVLGITDPDATVTINGVSALVRSDGKFFDRVTADLGLNKVTIIATSRYGKIQTVIRNVIVSP